MAERIEIRDGGWLLWEPKLYAPHEADRLLARLRDEVPWRQEQIFGRPVPRLNAWFADAGLTYAYSGISHAGRGWLPWLEEIRQRVEEASGAEFNSLLLNRYRDGQDSISPHADNEPELGENPVVATLSFGAEREFVLRHRKKKEKLVYRLGHGSLLVMGGTSQQFWLHGIPKTDAPVGERISLTFRRLISGCDGASRSAPPCSPGTSGPSPS
jgi:alkylated DNA repair dioxygenase AlkB